MYNTQVKQRIEIDILKQNYNQQQTLFDRDLDQMKIMLQQTEKAKLEANQKYALLSEKYNQKKIVDILDNQSFHKEGTYLFRTAKYAILGLDSQQRDMELPNLTKKIKPQGQNEINFGETFRVKTAISYKQIENDQSKIPVSEENNNISQSIINLMNNLEKQRNIYTTQEKQNEYETVPQKPIKSEGRSVSVTFDKEVQKNYHVTSEQSQRSQHILDEQIEYIEPQSEDSYQKQQQQEAIDDQIDELLNNIQIIVNQNKKLNDYTATTHKLQQQTERKYIPLVPDKGNSFKPVHFVKEQVVVLDSNILDKNVKDLDNLDKLISDLCN